MEVWDEEQENPDLAPITTLSHGSSHNDLEPVTHIQS